jgi:hypothetical protein
MKSIKRRDFLQTSVQSTASLAVGTTLLATQSRAIADDSPNERIVLALIGAGGRGSGHATAMARRCPMSSSNTCVMSGRLVVAG